MKTNKRFALSAVAGLGIAAMAAAPVMAADVVFEEPPAPAPAPIFESSPVSTWTGPYAGLSFGYGFAGRVTDDTNRITTDGWLGGAFGGFNFQDGQFVYGIEGDVNYSGVDGTNAGTRARSSVDGSIRARVGAAVTDDILIYGTVGGAAERLRLTDVATGNNDTNALFGWTAGAGVDAKLTDEVFARAEYRYTDYGRKDFDLGAGPERWDSSNHRVTVGLGIKF